MSTCVTAASLPLPSDFGIVEGLMTTVHATTGEDGPSTIPCFSDAQLALLIFPPLVPFCSYAGVASRACLGALQGLTLPHLPHLAAHR